MRWRQLISLSGRAEGRRLILGVAPAGRIIGFAVAADDPLAAELRDLEMSGAGELVSVFVRIDLGQETLMSNEDVLLSQIGTIAARGFIPGQRLRADGTLVDTNAANAGGHTLEAALGVPANSAADADFLGWELKALTVAKLDAPAKAKMVTVITPEPKAGLYAEQGVVDFIRRYGYADKRGRPDRLNVGGQYRAGVPVESTGLTLRLTGYEQRKGTSRGEITDIAAGAIELVDSQGVVAAAWPYIDLIEHWQRKHASAAYVPMLTKVEPSGRRFFRYSEEPPG